MLNYLWAAFILIGVVYAAFSGNIDQLTSGALDSSVDAVNLCIRMLGIMCMWTGLMKIAEKSGLIYAMSRGLAPALSKLFPTLPRDGKAMEHISTNMIANILGLGWAATPPGIKAMEELQKLNPDKTRASKEMCMFLIINLSSLQLVTINIIAYRAQYNSVSPQEIIGPGILATLCSTAAGIIFAKIMEKRRNT
ncbi:MAG: nucleoside recognition protein [Defluviitaleaceae bacterium]|nr:nucleoside recognition protein [Defluviitaleaceae bacterium]MCL2835338.1 nucleoside recognition protein [Defluviitaleaceae bacterium]